MTAISRWSIKLEAKCFQNFPPLMLLAGFQMAAFCAQTRVKCSFTSSFWVQWSNFNRWNVSNVMQKVNFKLEVFLKYIKSLVAEYWQEIEKKKLKSSNKMEKRTLLLRQAHSISFLSNFLWKIYIWYQCAMQTLLQRNEKKSGNLARKCNL